MKSDMRKIKYLAGIVAAFLIISCGDDFLDTKNLYEKLDVDYYSNPQEIAEALTGAYASIPIRRRCEQSDPCFRDSFG